MSDIPKVILCWSGGKDCAMALEAVRSAGELEVVALLSTITEDFGRVSMHGVRRELLGGQAQASRLPLHEVLIPADSDEALYERRMGAKLGELQAQGVAGVVFGDIALASVRARREEKLAQVGLAGHFPLWGRDTAELGREFVARGFQAVLTCVDTRVLDGRFAGREYDQTLLSELPAEVDPCGENGEFHTFVYAGPVFSHTVAFTRGEIVLREGRFNYCDLLDGGEPACRGTARGRAGGHAPGG